MLAGKRSIIEWQSTLVNELLALKRDAREICIFMKKKIKVINHVFGAFQSEKGVR